MNISEYFSLLLMVPSRVCWKYIVISEIFIVSIFSILLSAAAYAGGDSGKVKIVSIVNLASTIAVVNTTPNVLNPDSCGTNQQVAINTSDPFFSEMMSTILTAAAAGKTVDFYMVGCWSTPWGYTAPIAAAVTAYMQ